MGWAKKNVPGYSAVSNAVIDPVGKGLAGLDKAVGNAIPGGWGTIAGIAASAMGVPIAGQVGLGALTGSGVMRPGRGFNLQGAIMGGITAYGMGKLGEGLRGAAGADALAGSTSGVGPTVPGVGDFAGSLSDPTAGMAAAYQPPSIGSQIMGGDFSGAASRIGTGISDAARSVVDPNTYRDTFANAGTNLSQTGTGIKNLVGLGDITAKQAAAGFTGAGATATNTGLPILMGTTGQMAIDEAREQQQAADAANAANMQDYNTQMAIIESNRKRGEDAMRANPYQFAEGGNVAMYAKGGEAQERRDFLDMIDARLQSPPAQYVEGLGLMAPPQSVGGRLGANVDALGGNVRAGISGNAMMGPDKKIMTRPEMFDVGYRTNVGGGDLDLAMQRAINSMPGRGRDYAVSARYSKKFAEGGMAPRFLSGGGDGMSDSIKATINDKQEARLADGEFVVSSDVVSGLGNGSSKAGAKRLYDMMDRVRSARTGTKKQAPAVNPRKLMPA